MMRLGIIGCGLIGNKRALTVGAHTVAFVADRDPRRAEQLATKVGATAYQDWRAVIDADIDAVIVATAHDSLAPISLAAVEAGKHVLVEKPAARKAQEIAPIIAAANARRRIVKVGYNHRFHPAFQKAHQMVASGGLGPLMFIRGRYGHGGRVGYDKEWRAVPEISGGGELIDQGSHLIDLSRWLLGDLDLEYGAAPTYFWNMRADDNCFVALKSKRGQIAWLHASWTEWKNTFSFEIYGRDGKLAIDGLGGSYGTERLAYFKMRPEMGPPETTIWEFPFPDGSWAAEFQEFASAIAENRQPLANIIDAHAVLKIVDEIYGRSPT